MELVTGSGSHSDVDAASLRALFEREDFPDEFMILSQAPEVYMQAAGEGEGSYCLEHRDGDEEHHFTAGDDLDKRDLERAFLWYLAGDSRWRTEFRWERLTF